MKLIVCLSDNGGISFCGKRQSRDKLQIEQMLTLIGESRLFITEYSAPLFEENYKNIIVSNNPFELAKNDDYCFIENIEIPNLSFKEVVIYKWNRTYPATQNFDFNIIKNRTLVSAKEFIGNSHDTITEEVYK